MPVQSYHTNRDSIFPYQLFYFSSLMHCIFTQQVMIEVFKASFFFKKEEKKERLFSFGMLSRNSTSCGKRRKVPSRAGPKSEYGKTKKKRGKNKINSRYSTTSFHLTWHCKICITKNAHQHFRKPCSGYAAYTANPDRCVYKYLAAQTNSNKPISLFIF